MIPYRLIAYGVAFLAVIGALYGIYHSIDSRAYNRGKAEIRAEWAEANRVQKEADAQRTATAAQRLEDGNRASRVVYKTIVKSVDRIVDRPVYHDRCFDDDGLRLANAALNGALAPAGEPNGAVPSTDPARGGFRGINPEKAGGGGAGVLRLRAEALGGR